MNEMPPKFDDVPIYRFGNEISIAGMIYRDPQTNSLFQFLFPEEAVSAEDLATLKTSVENLTHDQWNKLIFQTDQLETEILTPDENGKLRKVVVRKCTRQIAQEISWKVFRRDNYKCRYCGNDKVPLTVDHLVLWEEGGPSIEDNLNTSCKKCNKTRGNMQFADWLNHPYYRQVSNRGLNEMEKQKNIGDSMRLHTIPKFVNAKSR